MLQALKTLGSVSSEKRGYARQRGDTRRKVIKALLPLEAKQLGRVPEGQVHAEAALSPVRPRWREDSVRRGLRLIRRGSTDEAREEKRSGAREKGGFANTRSSLACP